MRVDNAECNVRRNVREFNSQLLWVRDEFCQGEQSWHVGAGFPWQFHLPERRTVDRTALCAPHIAFSGVVPCQRQRPVTESLVQISQIVECRGGGRDRITPAVVPPVTLQTEALAGRRDELPQSGCTAVGKCIRIQRTFDNWQ